MGAVTDVLTADLLRAMIRNLQGWHSLYESDGVDVLCDNDGNEWSLWDIDVLYEMSQHYLDPRQRQAIKYCFYENLPEAKAAQKMSNGASPVTTYATAGLEELIHLGRIGMLPSIRGFRYEKAKAMAPKPVEIPVYYDYYSFQPDATSTVTSTVTPGIPVSVTVTQNPVQEEQTTPVYTPVFTDAPEGAFFYGVGTETSTEVTEVSTGVGV